MLKKSIFENEELVKPENRTRIHVFAHCGPPRRGAPAFILCVPLILQQLAAGPA
jgi:hypothetical protein